MINFSKTFHIERQKQEVFEFLADPANDPKWRESAVSSEWMTEGPIKVGSRLKSVDKLMGRKIESTSEVTVYDPPNKYGLKTLGGLVPFEFTMTLEPEGDGTRLTMEGQAEVGGFFKVAEGLVRRQLEKQLEADFAGQKRVLNRGQS